jgi:acetyl esterase/lipase
VAGAFFAVSVIGALFTLNALWPARRPEALTIPSFFAGWLTSELPFHHLAWQAIATSVWIALGALNSWPGVAGLLITLVSWIGIAVLIRRSALAPAAMEDGLRAGLGADYWSQIQAARATLWGPALRWRQIARPIVRRDAAVLVERDLTFAEPGGAGGRPLKLDVYRPADGRTGCPVLLFFHGSGWVVSDKREQGLPMMLRLASHGWTCVTANYRLSPRATFPDHLLDAKEALRWVREHGAEHGMDPGFVIVSGASAGGQLAALMALTPNAPEYQPGWEQVDTTVQGAVLIYGVYDMTNRLRARGRGFVRFLERVVMKVKLRDSPEAFAKASPVDQIRPDAPPTLIIHGDNDTLVPVAEARCFADALRKVSKSPVVYAELPGAQHAFEVFRTVRALNTVAGIERFCDYVYSLALGTRGTPGMVVPSDDGL